MPKVNVKIIKSEAPVAMPQQIAYGAEWMAPEVNQRGLKEFVKHSSILPQCIAAYAQNIAGYGLSVRYKNDAGKETPAMKQEWNKLDALLSGLSKKLPLKSLFSQVVELRETYGIAYLEVIRNLKGEIAELSLIPDVPTITKSADERVKKQSFCKYRQDVGGKTVYFKALGDERVMDLRTGIFGGEVSLENQANEIFEVKLGYMPYGEVRWLGNILGIDGSRRAENLNNNYFRTGRHIPLMLAVEGGTLTDESFSTLERYMSEIEGEHGQHKFVVLETANLDNRADFEDTKSPKINIHKLADVLQKDELFQEYLENNRKRVQSSFRLPDIYTGYSRDFNRSTSQIAHEVTEEQVFSPERGLLTWLLNNRLLAEYNFKYVEAQFLGPNISNVSELTGLLSLAERAGALTPNKAKEIAYKALGDVPDDFKDDWGQIPLAVAKTQPPKEQEIKKSLDETNQIVAVFKELKDILSQKLFTNDNECAIIEKPRGIIQKYFFRRNGKLIRVPEVSSSGANSQIPNFTAASLERHKKHYGDGDPQFPDKKPEYPELNAKQYAAKALKLARSATGDDILGHSAIDKKNGKEFVVRYEKSTGTFVKAYLTGVATMYPPKKGIDYYENQKAKDAAESALYLSGMR